MHAPRLSGPSKHVSSWDLQSSILHLGTTDDSASHQGTLCLLLSLRLNADLMLSALGLSTYFEVGHGGKLCGGKLFESLCLLNTAQQGGSEGLGGSDPHQTRALSTRECWRFSSFPFDSSQTQPTSIHRM